LDSLQDRWGSNDTFSPLFISSRWTVSGRRCFVVKLAYTGPNSRD